MEKTKKTAKTIVKIVKSMGEIAYGSASVWGIYQPKEPKKKQK